ncbi:MAG: penicillin-binding protein 1C [Burkholderiales bacterium]|nr:penicillin-binding protein 1C [Burkholderiales bacterium]
MFRGLHVRRLGPRGRRAGLVVLGLIVALLAIRLAPRPSILAGQSWSHAVFASRGELLRLTLADDQQYRLYQPLTGMAPAYVDAVQLYEDRWFYWHPGVNPFALLRSATATATGQRRQGGSTLTMQLARRLYHIDSRSVGGKLKQIGAALWLEVRYSKREILEAYLNLAPFGSNIEGAGAASLVYFRTPIARVNLPQAISLAVIPQNPRNRSAVDNGTRALVAARARLWQNWVAVHPADKALLADQQLALHAESRATLPFAAPHFVDLTLAAAARDARAPSELRTSLDMPLQSLIERVMADYLRTRSEEGINNGSAMLVDASTMEVKAMVGSANYFDTRLAGEVNGTQAKRSPGSTLKPFIYALALDQGILHPRTILKDAPTSFGAFSPENFDGRFVGPISAQDALVRSRNIPAVAVAAKLSKPNLYDFLKLAGVSRMASEAHYGLALVLGGGEVTMEELAQLYAVLANGGVWRPVRYQPAAPREDLPAAPRLLSPEASFITLDMLRQNPRPDTELPAKPAIAWKTGTSWGFRDAWTAGVFGRYVLVVWLGNFDGSSNPKLIGIEAAAPLFHRIVDAIRAEHLDAGEMAFQQPVNLRKVEVCAASGDLPDDLCTVRVPTWFIAGKSPIRKSALHRLVWVDKRSGLPTCHPDANSVPKTYEYWSSDMQAVFNQAGLPRRQPPPDCSATVDDGGPKIVSPLRAVTYNIRPSKPEPLLLRADAPAGVRTLFWFVDDTLVGRAAPGEIVAWNPPQPRHYMVRVVDEQGRADNRELTVEYLP